GQVRAPLVLLALHLLHVDGLLVRVGGAETEEDLREDLALVGDLREHGSLLSPVAPRDGRVRDDGGSGVVGARRRSAEEKHRRRRRGRRTDGMHDPYQSTSRARAKNTAPPETPKHSAARNSKAQRRPDLQSTAPPGSPKHSAARSSKAQRR